MGKHRTKRFSGSLDRYMKQDPLNIARVIQKENPNLKIENPQAEFEKVKTIQATPPKPEPEKEQKLTIEFPAEMIPANNEIMNDENMPLFCNTCDMQKSCPHGRDVLRKDQKRLVVCKKRNDFRQLITEAGTTDRQGLLAYMHKLRQINSVRIARLLYKEALSGGGQDRNLTLLIDKQIDNAVQEIKLITPQDKGVTNFSLHLTSIHKTVDAYNELPIDFKQYFLQSLKSKLNQLKNPALSNRIVNTHSLNPHLDGVAEGEAITQLPTFNLNNDVEEDGGKVVGSQDKEESINAENL